MRNLIYAINLTIDGCFDHTKGIVDDELLEYFTRLVRDADLLVYGRKTYQLMVPYWPDVAKNPSGETKADLEFAQAFESRNKFVFSRTLDRAEGTRKCCFGWTVSKNSCCFSTPIAITAIRGVAGRPAR